MVEAQLLTKNLIVRKVRKVQKVRIGKELKMAIDQTNNNLIDLLEVRWIQTTSETKSSSK